MKLCHYIMRYLMQGNKITSHPPKQRTAQEFILDAEKRTTNKDKVSIEEVCYPWVTTDVRPDVQKVFTVKLIEEYILKIKYISEVTNKSQQKIVREIISAGVDETLKSLDINKP